jgi:uncharacterized protein YjiS (DUF1127 family)
MSVFELTLPARTRGLSGLFTLAARAAALHRQRAALRRLDDRALEDIGITRAEADAEAGRPVWDAPRHWHR